MLWTQNRMRILSDPEKIIPDPVSSRNESVVICNLTHSQDGNTKVIKNNRRRNSWRNWNQLKSRIRIWIIAFRIHNTVRLQYVLLTKSSVNCQINISSVLSLLCAVAYLWSFRTLIFSPSYRTFSDVYHLRVNKCRLKKWGNQRSAR
jgi:hypothetical protein